jgi:Zn-dependent protease
VEAKLPPQYTTQPNPPPKPATEGRLKKALGPLAVLGVLLAKFKVLLLPLLKLAPLLKTGGTMLLSIGVYAMAWGWKFASGFVLLILVHECGHFIAAKRLGLRVGVPVFVPFMGAYVALKEAPRNAWIHAQVGIAGPLLGAVGAAMCYGLYRVTGNNLFSALAFTAFLLNLFNLAPFGTLDGARVLPALPRLFSLSRAKPPQGDPYYEVTGEQRLLMGFMYFGLIAFLVLGMMTSYVKHE